MIELVATRPRRGAIEHFYRTAHQRDETVEHATVRARTRDELDAVMQEMEAAARRGGFDSADAQIVHLFVDLDSTGRTPLARAFAELAERVEQLQAECAARMTTQRPAGCIREFTLIAMDFDLGYPASSTAPSRVPQPKAPPDRRRTGAERGRHHAVHT